MPLLPVQRILFKFLPARRSASISDRHVCLSVCLSVRLSQVGVLLRRLNAGSRKQRHTTTEFSDAENLGKTETGSPPTEAPIIK